VNLLVDKGLAAIANPPASGRKRYRVREHGQHVQNPLVAFATVLESPHWQNPRFVARKF
jgi:hypothetical protein